MSISATPTSRVSGQTVSHLLASPYPPPFFKTLVSGIICHHADAGKYTNKNKIKNLSISKDVTVLRVHIKSAGTEGSSDGHGQVNIKLESLLCDFPTWAMLTVRLVISTFWTNPSQNLIDSKFCISPEPVAPLQTHHCYTDLDFSHAILFFWLIYLASPVSPISHALYHRGFI